MCSEAQLDSAIESCTSQLREQTIHVTSLENLAMSYTEAPTVSVEDLAFVKLRQKRHSPLERNLSQVKKG